MVVKKNTFLNTARFMTREGRQLFFFLSSAITFHFQEIVLKAGKTFVVKSEERKVTRVMNQLISGNSNLNYMMSKIDNTKSELCDTCKVKKTINHYGVGP